MAMTERHPVEYAQQVERVQLVSAFLPSLLLGEYAPHDESDPGGMNMLDVRSGSWHEGCLAAVEADAERPRSGCAQGLASASCRRTRSWDASARTGSGGTGGARTAA